MEDKVGSEDELIIEIRDQHGNIKTSAVIADDVEQDKEDSDESKNND